MGLAFGVGFRMIFILVFLIILGSIVVAFIKGIGQWNKNNHSPRLTVEARVVAKRMDVTHHHHANAGDATGAHG